MRCPPKARVVKSTLAAITRMAMVDAAYRDVKISGRSLRRSGSQYVAYLGLEIALIQIWVIWSSQTVSRCVAKAPLATISNQVKALLNGPMVDEHRKRLLQIPDRASVVDSLIDSSSTHALRSEMCDLSQEVDILRELVCNDVIYLKDMDSALRGTSPGSVQRVGGSRCHLMTVGTPSASDW